MRISRLVESKDSDAAGVAAQHADAAGVVGVWLPGRGGWADPRTVARARSLPVARYVLELDPDADIELPVGVEVDVVVAANGSWAESLGAIAGTVEPDASPLCWVFADDIGTVAAAARAGVGAVLPALENPDQAAEWVAEYDAELGAATARPIAARVNAACAAIVELGDDPDATIGLIERYRQAGVDEVILRGASQDDDRPIAAIVAEFNDSEVREMANRKSEEREPSIVAMVKRAGQPEGAGAPGATGASDASDAADAADAAEPASPSAFSLWFKRRQEQLVAGMSDRQLDAVVGSRVGVRALLMVMASRFRPERSGGFVGEIQLTLKTGRGQEVWTIDCRADGARSRRGPAKSPRLRIEASLADFLRVGTGEVSAPTAVLSGKLLVLGDFALALRMGEMFDGPALV